MDEIRRREILERVRQIAMSVRRLVAYDGSASPPDWRPFVAELADELAEAMELIGEAR